MKLFLALLYPAVVFGQGTFVDDVDQTATWTGAKPKIICGAMDAVAFFHFGMEPSQIMGTFGERSSSGSNFGGVYADGNENADELGDHSTATYDPTLFPADPNDAERAFLNSIQLDLSPSCSASNFYCDEINTSLLDQNGWPDIMIFGSFYGFLLTDELRDEAASRGVQIIQLTNVYGPAQAADIPRSMPDMIKRMEDLARAVGVEGITDQTKPDKESLCLAVTNFKAAAKTAQEKGVRAMAGFLPYRETTANQETGAFLASPERDSVLAMFEELGMAIVHNDAEGYYETFLDDDGAGTFSATNPMSSGGVTQPPVPYNVDFWIYDDRTTIDFIAPEFAVNWPHPALVARQFAYYPANARIFSYRHAAEILQVVTPALSAANKVVSANTQCTPSLEGGYSGDLHRGIGLGPGEYACNEPHSEYAFCVQFRPGFCFSGKSSVEVLNKGSTSMEELKIGDMVHVGAGKYELVYSFGHFEEAAKAEYLEIQVDTVTKPLEMSHDHLLFVEKPGVALSSIPASAVRVGDRVAVGTSDNMQLVTKIGTTISTGAYAPFTSSGTIMVNNILVSSYVTPLGDNKAGVELPFGHEISVQWMAHAFNAPHRMVCMLNFAFCENETYTDSISNWVIGPLHVVQWILKPQNAIIRGASFCLVVPFLVLVFMLEFVVSMLTLGWLCAITACIVVHRAVGKTKTR